MLLFNRSNTFFYKTVHFKHSNKLCPCLYGINSAGTKSASEYFSFALLQINDFYIFFYFKLSFLVSCAFSLRTIWNMMAEVYFKLCSIFLQWASYNEHSSHYHYVLYFLWHDCQLIHVILNPFCMDHLFSLRKAVN